MPSGDGGTMYYVKPSGASAASTFASPTASWQDASLTGIPAGERFTSVVSYGGKLYATTSASKLYEGSGVTFATKALSGDYSPSLILGGLKINGVPSLTLLGANAAGSKAFLTYGIASSSVTHIGEAPDGAFPSSGETVSYELAGGNYQGNALYLAGGITASGKASPSLCAQSEAYLPLRLYYRGARALYLQRQRSLVGVSPHDGILRPHTDRLRRLSTAGLPLSRRRDDLSASWCEVEWRVS